MIDRLGDRLLARVGGSPAKILVLWVLFAGSSLSLVSGTPLFPFVIAVWFGPMLACAMLAGRFLAENGRKKP